VAFITVPNSFVSGMTFRASYVNENLEAIVAGLSDGTKDLNVKNIETVSSCIVNSDVTFNTGLFSGNVYIGSDLSFQTKASISGNTNVNLCCLGPRGYAYRLLISPSTEGLFSPQSYVGAQTNWIPGYKHIISFYSNSPRLYYPEGTILILRYHSSGAYRIYNGYATDESNYMIGLKLKAVVREITNYNKTLVLQLVRDVVDNTLYFEEINWEEF
jgi:hypothetical protein